MISRGESCIVDPLGRILAGPPYNEGGLLAADLDLDEFARGKFALDAAGHHARPDVFRPIVDTAATTAVVANSAEPGPTAS